METAPRVMPAWRRWLGNYYGQLALGYALAAAVLIARWVLFPENAAVLLSPLYAWLEPSASWWAVPAVAVGGAAVALLIYGSRAGRVWPAAAAAFGAAVAVNVAPGGWRDFPFRLLKIFIIDARTLFGAPNVFANYVEITKGFSIHGRVRPGMTYWLMGVLDGAVGGNPIAVQLALVAAAAAGVVAVYYFARPLLGRRENYGAAAFFALAPSVLLFGGAPDGFYGLLGTAALALALRAVLSRRWWWLWAAAAGVVFAFGLTASYVLALVALFVVVLAVAVRIRGHAGNGALATPVVMLLAVAVALAAFQLVTGYDHLAALRRAYATAQTFPTGGDNIFKMTARALGRGGVNVPAAGARPYSIWVFGNLFAFFFVMGVPFAVLYLREIFGILRDRARRRSLYGTVTVAFALAFVATNFSGVVLGETERLWLFLLAGFAAPAAAQLERLRAGPYGSRAVTVSLSLMVGQAFLYHVLFKFPY